jgi:hypothetical protein
MASNQVRNHVITETGSKNVPGALLLDSSLLAGDVTQIFHFSVTFLHSDTAHKSIKDPVQSTQHT